MRLCTRCEGALEDSGWTCGACGFTPATIGPFTAFAPGLAGSHEGYDPVHFSQLYELESRNYWFRSRNTAPELSRKLAEAGFATVMTTSFVSFLLPLMWLSRLRQRTPTAQYDPLIELRVGRVVNTALEAVLACERRLIEWGVRFPAGGSLLVVARRA